MRRPGWFQTSSKGYGAHSISKHYWGETAHPAALERAHWYRQNVDAFPTFVIRWSLWEVLREGGEEREGKVFEEATRIAIARYARKAELFAQLSRGEEAHPFWASQLVAGRKWDLICGRALEGIPIGLRLSFARAAHELSKLHYLTDGQAISRA